MAMSKKPSILIIVLIVIYLLGLAYVTLKKEVSKSPSIIQPNEGQMVAPDGTVLRGPSSPPGLAPGNAVPQDPLTQSTGPTMPPPQ